MVIAKKILFGKTPNRNTFDVPDPVDGTLYIPVIGYTQQEVSDMWSAVPFLSIPSKFAEFGLIGAGGSCYNPGYYSGNIFDLVSYRVYCDPTQSDEPIMPHVDSVLGTADDECWVAYINDAGDGFFWCAGSNFTFKLDNEIKFGLGFSNRNTFGLSRSMNGDTHGYICFLFVTSDNEMGMFRLNTVSKENCYFNWLSHEQRDFILTFLETLEPLPEDEDPYAGGEYSSTSGETGDFSRPGEDVDIPALPALDASDAGFVTLFSPTLAQLNSLASYMWANDIASLIEKMFANPMDAIIGLAILPGPVPYGGTRTVTVGNVSTGVAMNTVSSQFYTVDCGSLMITNFSGSYLDYNPHTKIEIYLPYIGMRALNADDVMGKTVSVVYHVDALSGACVAYIKVNGTVLYSFLGQCACSVPISGGDYTQVINGVLNIAGAIGSTVATGGATAPMAISSIASTAVNGLKTTCEKSGAISGTGGLLSIQRPYLIITTPRQCLPREQNKMIGYPSFITENLSDLSGYTEVNQIHLENVPCTADELTEIENLLKGGVIL